MSTMIFDRRHHHRKSIRLRGFDYSQCGAYFVTACTKGRACIFGGVCEGKMNLSEIGVIVEMCWRKIPKHFEGVRSDIFQVMPNHIHGIIEIPDSSILSHVGVEYIQPQQSLLVEMPRYQHVVPNSLGSIIRSFKAAVTRKVHGRFGTAPEVIWQRNYYDRIIRDDTEYFFTEQYIDLNPLMWELDTDYPTRRRPSIEELRKTLERDHQMNGQMLEDFIEHEVLYREWLRRGFTREDRLG